LSDDQQALFEPKRQAGVLLGYEPPLAPAARLTDPETSHEAAEKVTSGGTRRRDMADILAVVRRAPGLTYREIHARLPHIAEPATVAKRLSDLERVGEIEKSDKRVCRIGGNPCTTWQPRD
jgi:hypothetical protein